MTTKRQLARLDRLCGGPPTQYARCGLCTKTKGPYYDSRMARDAIREHIRWQHEMTPVLLPEVTAV